jgi:hypothetical protein
METGVMKLGCDNAKEIIIVSVRSHVPSFRAFLELTDILVDPVKHCRFLGEKLWIISPIKSRIRGMHRLVNREKQLLALQWPEVYLVAWHDCL